MICEQVCVLVNIDEENNEGVCDDVLDMEKIVTDWLLMICHMVVMVKNGEVKK
jgi:hypothetical protein